MPARGWPKGWFRPCRRLKPIQVVETLDRSARLELDLQVRGGGDFRIRRERQGRPRFRPARTALGPDRAERSDDELDHRHSADRPGRRSRPPISTARRWRRKLLQSFLRHAIRDGFFHADMHPGNLFALHDGGVAAVDFGIMGRIGPGERRFLAEILYGFITRDYKMVARRHFEMGYVPADQSVDDFTLAIRSIGEPLHGRLSRDISMARVLGQLFSITDLFNMQTRPELLMLQKTMVLVEGVARDLDPDLDIWTVSEPVVSDWLRRQAGPIGRFEELRDHGTRLIGLRRAAALDRRTRRAPARAPSRPNSQGSRSRPSLAGIITVLLAPDRRCCARRCIGLRGCCIGPALTGRQRITGSSGFAERS